MWIVKEGKGDIMSEEQCKCKCNCPKDECNCKCSKNECKCSK